MWTWPRETPLPSIPQHYPKLFHICMYNDFIYEYTSPRLATSSRHPLVSRRSNFLKAECKAEGTGKHYIHMSCLLWTAAGCVSGAQIWSQLSSPVCTGTRAGQCVMQDLDHLLAFIQTLFFLRNLLKGTPATTLLVLPGWFWVTWELTICAPNNQTWKKEKDVVGKPVLPSDVISICSR